MIAMVSRWNQNLFFKYISSVRLAVPVMLALILAVAAGTVLESMHNAEYAKLALYDSTWFNALLGLLALNVFCSMLSRYPWKVHQVGFVITHIGILVLLVGSWVTKIYGVDGSLQVAEGQSQSSVILPRLMVGYQFEGSPTLNSVVFDKTLFEKDRGDLKFINNQIGHVVEVEQFVPFAEIEKGYSGGEGNGTGTADGPIGISFGLKSAFFDVKDWLHTVDNPEFQMGPATLRIVVDEKSSDSQPPALREVAEVAEVAQAAEKPLKKKPLAKKPPTKKVQEQVLIYDQKTNQVVREVRLQELRGGVSINGIKIQLSKSYQRALVADNKIVESEDPTSPPNPALELTVEKGSEKLREVLYARFPQFSLNKDGAFGLRFEFVAQASAASAASAASDASEGMAKGDLPAGHPPIGESAESDGMGAPAIVPGKNIIEFHVNRQQPDQVRVELWKSGEKVGEKIMKEGESFQTPWMGMQIFLGSINFGSEMRVEVKAIRPEAGKNLPPSAVFVKPLGQPEGFWMTQGDVKNITVAGRNAYLVFSNETVKLPFEIALDKFTKKDYPGTETPYSYESLVTHSRTQEQTLISMNEPLKSDGFTFYQASYSLNPGQPPVSILSVNRDPGRWVKYLGSLIMSIGIVIFTLMRSRFYKHSAKRA